MYLIDFMDNKGYILLVKRAANFKLAQKVIAANLKNEAFTAVHIRRGR